jgi:hypothetical protein
MGKRLRFTVDPERSTVAIEARSSVHPIRGQTNGIVGTVDVAVNGDQLVLSPKPAAHIELPVGQLSSGNKLYDGELHRRIESRRFPVIVGDLAQVRRADDGGFRVSGALQFHGASNDVEAEIAATVNGDRLVADWHQVVDIREFGVDPPRILLLRVYPDVGITVHIEASVE